ncbi:hypothetical protein O9929_00520 [Vibrio lentus]|nr:hypothetical protein [Vibrio lentus]
MVVALTHNPTLVHRNVLMPCSSKGTASVSGKYLAKDNIGFTELF